MPDLVAAVDCGTNSTRLLVGDGTTTVERLMRITRLGEGVDATGRLAEPAIDRVVDVLCEFREVLDRHGVTRVRASATSAARDAVNRDDFFDAAEAVLGVRPEMLPGAEEGRLSFAGATADLDPADGPFLVLDIGGGSTEFVFGTSDAEGVLSCDIGCVRLTEQRIGHDPPLPEELASCLSIVGGHVDDVVREVPSVAEARTLVGLAGETVVDYSLRLKRELAGPNVWVAGYCNTLPTYIPSLRVLREGGYEGGDHRRYTNFAAPFDESIERRITGKVHQLNERLGGKRAD